MSKKIEYQPLNYRSNLSVRWCPGCGDYGVLNSMQRAMADLQLDPDKIAVISGIGCSSRLPYYVGTYGFHTIHGRGLAISTGVKVANPELSVWHFTGDGDCLAIGGNHFIHGLRRNIDINIILHNNRVYGLTKGQYSPTSMRGYVSPTSPLGTVEDPFDVAALCFGAKGNFFARTIDVDMSTSVAVMKAAENHRGAAVVEVLQNCVIFNNGVHNPITDKEWREERTITLKHGEPMVFGKEKNRGLVLDGLRLKAVTIGEGGYADKDILVHDAQTIDNTMHILLGEMSVEKELPVALGVIRSVATESYERAIEKQIAEAKTAQPNITTLRDYLLSKESWEVR